MATTTLQDYQALDPISLNATTESSAIAVPDEANWMFVSTDKILTVRLGSGANAVGYVARNTDGAHPWRMDVSSLRRKSLYLYNTEGTSASVLVSFQTRKV